MFLSFWNTRTEGHLVKLYYGRFRTDKKMYFFTYIKN